MNKLVYLCHSNKGRSVALAAYTQYFLDEKGIYLNVDSAGVGSEHIQSLRERGINQASQTTARILLEEGIDVSSHRLNCVEEVIEGTDLVLVTDDLSMAMFRAEFPRYKDVSFLARQYAGFKRDVEIFGPCADYRHKKEKHWSEVSGYRHMLREIKIISKRIAERIAEER